MTRIVFSAFTIALAAAVTLAPEWGSAEPAKEPAPAASAQTPISGSLLLPVVARKPLTAPAATPPADGATTPDATVPPAAAAAPVPPYPAKATEGPRHTLNDCMATWDKATHMTKADWRATCKRSIKEAERFRRD
jgi:hypothetical protein